MEEARQHLRVPIRTELAYVILPGSSAHETQTRDISASGFRVVLEQPLASGTQLQVAMLLPGVEEPVNAIAEIVWSQEERLSGKTEQRRSVVAGARYTEIAPKDREAISEVIRRLVL